MATNRGAELTASKYGVETAAARFSYRCFITRSYELLFQRCYFSLCRRKFVSCNVTFRNIQRVDPAATSLFRRFRGANRKCRNFVFIGSAVPPTPEVQFILHFDRYR